MNRKTQNSSRKPRTNAQSAPIKRLQKVADRLERDTRTKRGRTKRRPTQSTNNVAAHLWTHLTSPTSTLPGYWPSDTRESLKMPLRMQFSISIPASGSGIIFPTPGLTPDAPSLSHIVDTAIAAPLWSTAGTLLNPLATQTQTLRTFAQLPFSRATAMDGMAARCTKYTVKLTYVGPLLNRAGTMYIYEEPNIDVLARNGANAGSYFNTYLAECIDSSTNTRVVSVTKCPEVIADFHPVLWKGDNTIPGAEAAAWRTASGVETQVASDNSSIYNGTSGFDFSTTVLNRASKAPSGFIAIENNTSSELEFRLDVIAHYEINGGSSRLMSTPSPALASHLCDNIKNALVRAKYHHVHSPHETFAKIAATALKDVVGGNGKQPKMTVGNVAKAGASLAGLFL